MLATVNANVNRAEMTSDIAKSTSEKLEFSNKKFVETIDASIHVSHKINVISEIARKTDILSINAAIEAARSGDSGLGFAVVAQEIRKLADKSSISALEIEGLTKSGIKMSEISKAKLNELVDEIIKSAELVSEIVTASKEQQLGIEQINRSITGLIEIANINTAASEEISVSSQELLAQANLLNNAIMEFKI
jgi:methyl-accepting chemotaxis protein